MRQALVALLLLAALTAGCADPNADTDSADDTSFEDAEAFDEVEVTETTGAIRGVVVNEAIVPLEGALVQISNGPNQTTDKDGAFVFNNLEPGEYFLQASLVGYKSIQQAASVVAGEEPPVTKITLLADAATQPYATVQQWNGFLQCGVNVLAVSLNPCAFTGSDNVHDFGFDPGRIPDFSQGEAIWDGTQPAGNWLWFSIHDPETSNSSCVTVNAQSPAILPYNQTQMVDCYGDEADHMTYKIFPGNSQDTPPVPTFLTNQQYDIYVQYFYGFVPREGYTLVEDGICTTPDICR